MLKTDISGTTEINGEGIKKHFKNIEPWQPILELVWNGLDARAEHVHVIVENNDLHGVDRVTVLDDGDGINPLTLKDTFGRFNDSNKKEDATQHGAHGRGRLAFHRICNRAVWHTKCSTGEARIQVEAGNIKHFAGRILESKAQHQALKKLRAGTIVELDQFTEQLPGIHELREKFSAELGWFLAL
jgi:DNA topoisomerase VI subunit B